MKQLSIGLNVVLLVAVVFLYIKVFGGKSDTTPSKVVNAPTNNNGLTSRNIAFVELDSLNERIGFIKSRRQQLEAEQRGIESEWQNGYRGLENRKNEFLKKGNAITQQEAEKFQNELYQQQQQIDERKQAATQKLSDKSYQFMDDIQKRLKDFLAEYNKDKKYQYILTIGTGFDYMLYKDTTLNITNEVVAGMNDVLKEKK
ncbi:OmpH family outer membrane protein [Ferruginibacter yonginensis]|uniref:OmpH family outer membrane protein n=1 Tax=Ferruginibacter yonginensis TaxID=1310416 RepID=A0ABV8QPL5_9BACT